ncbi:extracellular solute-binding protein [Paenibacillus psychroresistens]|uniref:Extracellular solute-binding protein n=1 Tax=Paenibacillus psychroresistens TaxID=1778678 RepID=A0A6B8RUJ2_9BACL|nr:extracellular solute-binding protein [Paenibacillus psychroresistens]QGQ98956.1 extracellular solute-binding protein [Paenibacillus psychroresistens]
MQKRRYFMLALALFLMLSIVLSACSSKKDVEEAVPTTAPPASSTAPAVSASAAPPVTPAADEKEVTLRFYFGGDKKSATDEIWKAVSDYVKAKGLNVNFNISTIPFPDYKQKMLVMAASGDDWDMNFDGDWLSIFQMAAKGGYMSLNDLLPKYAPNLYKKYQDAGTLQAATVNGEIIALPWTMEMNQRIFANWRSDLAKKAGINPAPGAIKTIEDVDKFVHEFKKAYPNQKFGRSGPLDLIQPKYELVKTDWHFLYFDVNDPLVKLVPIEQTPAYREAINLAEKWKDDGIINSDALVTKEDGAVEWRNGKNIFTITSHEWTYNTMNFSEPGAEREGAEMYPDKKQVNRTALANVVAINKNSKNADKVLRFLDMLEVDQKLYDLVQYGIEGKTYVLNGNKADYPAGMDGGSSNYMEWGGQWALWKPQYMRPNPSYPDGFWQKEADFAHEPTNIVNPIDGLLLAEDNVKTEAAKRDQLQDEFGKALELGSIPKGKTADQAVDEYIAKQKAAGVDKFVAEAQKQVDAFLASKKK